MNKRLPSEYGLPGLKTSDLSKDFSQIINIAKKTERKDSNFLYCEIDPASKLF